MPIESDYAPKYVDSLDDVPVAGPDRSYSPGEKRKALFDAETQLELDVNAGEEIDQNNVTNAHKSAVINLATHVLTHAAEDPSSVTLGDMASGGGEIPEYSSRYLERYNQIVDDILGTEGADGRNFSVAVNTSS